MIETISTAVTGAALVLLVILAMAIVGAAFRMVTGPSYADRFIALDMLTGVAVAACALTAVITSRREFLDVGLGIGLIAFLATIALASFLEKKEKETP